MCAQGCGGRCAVCRRWLNDDRRQHCEQYTHRRCAGRTRSRRPYRNFAGGRRRDAGVITHPVKGCTMPALTRRSTRTRQSERAGESINVPAAGVLGPASGGFGKRRPGRQARMTGHGLIPEKASSSGTSPTAWKRFEDGFCARPGEPRCPICLPFGVDSSRARECSVLPLLVGVPWIRLVRDLRIALRRLHCCHVRLISA